MTRNARIVAVLVVLAVAAILFVVFRGHGDSTDSDPETDRIASKGPRAPIRSSSTSQAAQLAEFVSDPDRAGTLRLEGQVVDENLDPVAGARVTIDTNPPRFTDSGEDGSFYFDSLVGRPYTLAARSAEGSAGPITARLTDSSEPVILKVAPTTNLEVTVLEADTRTPIAGATVELRGIPSDRVTTGDDGVAVLSNLPAGFYQLAAWTDHYAPTLSRLWVVSGAQQQQQEILLQQGASVSGVVLATSGSPVEGARVVYASAADRGTRAHPLYDAVTTGADGAFTFAALPAGSFRFRSQHDTYAPGESELVTLDGINAKTGVEIRVDAGAIIRGRVVTAGGDGAAWSTVRAAADSGGRRGGRGPGPMGNRPRQVYADEHGVFEIAALPRKPISLVALHESASSETATVDMTSVVEKSDVELILELDGVIAGTVVSQSGDPVEGAQVSLRPDFRGGADIDRNDMRMRGFFSSELTDAAGSFQFRGLRENPYVLMASPPGSPTMGRRMRGRDGVSATTGDLAVKLVLEANGAISGKVAFEDGEVPAMFTVSTGGFRGGAIPFSTADGSFEVGDLPAGSYRLRIRGPDFADISVPEVEVSAGETQDVGTQTAHRGRRVSGRVIDSAGTAVASATVTVGRRIFGSGNSSSGGGGFRGFATRDNKTTTSDDRGEFSISGVPPSELVLVAEHDTRGRSTVVSLPRTDESSTGLEVILVAPGAIEGRITSGGAPVEDVMVSAQSQTSPDASFSVTTGADGRYRFDVLSPDRYLVSAVLRGARFGMGTFSRATAVETGKTSVVDIAVPEGKLTLRVTPRAEGEIGFAMVYSASNGLSGRTARDLDLALANRDGGQASRSMIMGGEPAEIAELAPGRYGVCIVPFPSELRGREAFRYMDRIDGALPAFCDSATLTPSPDVQEMTIQVQIPDLVPGPDSEP